MKKRRPGAPVKLTRATIASFQAVCAHGFSGCFSGTVTPMRSEEHTSELQSQSNLVCRLLLEKKKTDTPNIDPTVMSSRRKGTLFIPGRLGTALIDTRTR